MKLIFLTGMPGAGKSYWANKIAHKYQLQLVDLDTYITEKEKLSVPEIFDQSGESGFREKERAALKEVIAATTAPTIVSCGGGTPCYGDNMEMMKNAGIVIYLQANVESLFQYLKDDAQPRPMLPKSGNIRTHLQTMLDYRKEKYEMASYVLPIDNLSLSNFDKIFENV